MILHYQSHGRGEPVLILHGLFGSSRNWSVFARKLAEQYRVITVDLRNHGNSGHADAMAYTDMATDIRHVLEECGLDRASIIGHSMGGKVAMTFALCFGPLLGHLVILDIAPVSYNNAFRSIIESLEELPLPGLNSRKHADELLADKITDTSLRLFLLQNLVKVNDDFRWRVNLASVKNNLAIISGFPEFRPERYHGGPALFLGGMQSSYLLPEHVPVINRYFSEATVDYIEDAGHWLHIDQPGHNGFFRQVDKLVILSRFCESIVDRYDLISFNNDRHLRSGFLGFSINQITTMDKRFLCGPCDRND